MTFITSDPTAIYRHALNAWVSPLATCALPKGVCYLLTYLVSSLLSALTSLTSVWTNRTRHDRYDSLLIPRRASSFVCRTSGDASKSAIGTVLPSCALRRYL